MDVVTLILCVIFMFMLISAYDNAYGHEKKAILILIAGAILLPVVLFTSSVLTKTVVIEKIYSVHSYANVIFDEPADIEVTTITYPKWSALSTDATFKQLPKGK